MTRNRILLGAAAATLSLASAGTAIANWEPAMRVDNTSTTFRDTTAGDVALGANGLATIVFAQGNDAESGISPYVVRRAADAAGWTPPARVGLPEGVLSAGTFRAGASPDGGFASVFTGVPASPSADNPNTLRGLQWSVGGQAFTTTTPGIPRPSNAQIAADGQGRLYVVALSGSTDAVMFSQFAGASGWSTPVELATGAAEPAIAATGAGDVVVAYSKSPGDATNARVYLRRRLAGAADFTPETDGNLNTPSDQPAVAFAPDRTITVAYRQPSSNNLASPPRIRAIRWTIDAPRPSTATIDDVSPVDQQSGAASDPKIGVDGASRVTAAWVQTAPLTNSRTLMSAERISGSFSDPQTVGPVFSPNFGLAVDSSGVANTVVIEGANATSTSLVARRRASGGPWVGTTRISPAGGVVSCVATSCFEPQIEAVPGQVDTFYLMVFGSSPNTQTRGYATRFSGAAPPGGGTTTGPAEDCPVGYNKIEGTSGNDQLGGTPQNDAIFGRAGNDHIGGGGGNDCMRGADGNDSGGGEAGNDEYSGGEGNDSLRGDAGRDVLLGNAGDDSLFGGSDDDTLVGDAGDDRLSAGTGNDRLEGGAGTDRLLGGEGNDTVSAGDNNDVVSTSTGDDRVTAGSGDDRVNGGSGRNSVAGEDGNDRLRGGEGRDLFVGGDGLDRMFGLGANDSLIGGEGADVGSGGEGDDRIFGRDGNDRLRGGDGADRVVGGADDDRLWGDAGEDLLSGGSGNDVIHAADGDDDRVSCGRGRDYVIADRGDRVARTCERVRFRTVRSQNER